MIEQINENVYMIDTLASNQPGYTSVFVIKGRRLAILDSGVSLTALNIVEDLERSDLNPKDVAFICLSHAHYDHAGGAHELLGLLRERGNDQVKVACTQKHSLYLSQEDKLEKILASGLVFEGELAGVMEPISEQDFYILEDGDTIDLDTVTIRVINTPGHERNHMAFEVPESDFLFVGDACGFLCGEKNGNPIICPTSFPPEYRHNIYISTLEKISAIPVSKIGFAHFGILKEAAEPLKNAIKTANHFYSMAKQISTGTQSLEEITVKLMNEYGRALNSTFPDHIKRNLVLEAMIQGLVFDLSR